MTPDIDETFAALQYNVEEDEDGVRRYLNQAGQRHRVGGPAVIWPDGSLFWYQNGVLHREDGPAIEWANGRKQWILEGIGFTEEDFNAKMKSNESNGTT